MLKKNKYLIPIISIIFLVVPLTAHALPILDEIFNALDIALAGVEEAAAPLIAAFIKLFLYFIAGYLALLVSATLFNVVTSDPNWFSLSSPIVKSGWSFMVGLADMFLILILIFIAICFILKIETFKTKKTLVNLIIVAFLLNFSLLFVKIIVDVPIFAFNTFNTAAGGNISGLISQVISPLTGSMTIIITVWGLFIAALAISFMTPIAAFAQLGFIVLFPFLIPFLGVAAFFIWAAFLLAGIFFTYVFLFGVRAVILAIFAILAPLAFLALILPQTKKYWNMWLKTVIEWAFLGVVLLFFIVLGFKGLRYLTPSEYLEKNPYAGNVGIIEALKQWFIYYFFLFIYLLFVAGISKKLMPSFAEGMISGAKQLGGMIWTTGIKPIGEATWKGAGRAAAEQKGKEELAKEVAKERGIPYKPSLALRMGRVMAKPVRVGHRIAGTTPEEEVMKDLAETEAKAEKIRDPELLLRKYKTAKRFKNDFEALGIASTMIGKGKGFKKTVEENLTPEEGKRLGIIANRLRVTKEAERIGRFFINQAEDMGFKPLDAEDTAKGYRNIKDKLIDEAEKDEIKDFAKNFWDSPEAKEAIQKFWAGPQLGRAADEFGRKFIEDYMEAAEAPDKGIDWFLKNNPKAAIYLSGNAAQDLGFRSLGGLDRKEVSKKIQTEREFLSFSPYIIQKSRLTAEDPMKIKKKMQKELENLETRRKVLEQIGARTVTENQELQMLINSISDLRKKLTK